MENGGVLGYKVAEHEQSKRGKKEDANLQKWLSKFNDSWSYAQNNYHQQWERNWKLYHNIRTKRSHDGVVKTFVPMVNSTINTMVATLFNSNPSVKYIPNNQDQKADTEALNDIYADFARRDGWVQKNKINGKQGLITGNFACFYEWKMDKNGGYVHKEVVPIRDMIIDPSSHSYEDWRYVGRRFFASKKSLEKEKIYDFKTGKMVKRFKNTEDLCGGSDIAESDKAVKDSVIGSIAPTNNDQIECIEIWTKKKVVVIANRTTIIEERENPHYMLDKALYEQRKAESELKAIEWQQRQAEWNANRAITLSMTGMDMGDFTEPEPVFDEEFDEECAGCLPFAHGRDYEDVSLPYGDSDVDIIADQQELLNDLTELNIEAVLYQLYPEKTLDPKFSTWANDMNPRPGKVYTLPAGALNWNNPPAIPGNAFNERMNVKDEMREAVSISQITKGVSSADSVTATEIKAQVGQADIRITEKAQTLANDFFFQEAKIVLKFIQLYAPDEMWVRSYKDTGAIFTKVNTREFLGEYTPMVTLDIEKKMQESQEYNKYMQAYQMLIADPTNNLPAVKSIMYKKLMPWASEEEIKQITEQPQIAAQAMPMATGQPMAEMPQEGMMNE